MPFKTRFWNAVLVVLSGVNLVAVWFAAGPGETWHAASHAALALAFGLWAQARLRLEVRIGPHLSDQADKRFDRLERAIDAVALEVERIGEMERFAGKILAGRAPELEPRVADPTAALAARTAEAHKDPGSSRAP